jgi:hypothetical protein
MGEGEKKVCVKGVGMNYNVGFLTILNWRGNDDLIILTWQ